jgi:hypothetical protein
MVRRARCSANRTGLRRSESGRQPQREKRSERYASIPDFITLFMVPQIARISLRAYRTEAGLQ